MLFLLAVVSASLGPSEGPQSLVPPPPARCEDVRRAAIDRTVRGGKLGDMPPAQEIKAVWRLDENGCAKPVVVRAEVGRRGR